jgi:hypothetical protein
MLYYPLRTCKFNDRLVVHYHLRTFSPNIAVEPPHCSVFRQETRRFAIQPAITASTRATSDTIRADVAEDKIAAKYWYKPHRKKPVEATINSAAIAMKASPHPRFTAALRMERVMLSIRPKKAMTRSIMALITGSSFKYLVTMQDNWSVCDKTMVL